MTKRIAPIFTILFLSVLRAARADSQPQSLFDPARHMHISEVKPGMKGYGLTVFRGTKIEKFDVEVVDVVKNFNPKYDVVLIRCPQDYLKNTGPIEGMSGSPIFLYDDTGKPRMVGAFAYGWSYSKDCLAGVQPIEYMLQLPTENLPPTPGAGGKSGAVHFNSNAVSPRWSLDQVPLRPWNPSAKATPSFARSMLFSGQSNMHPLATPLMTGGASSTAMAKISQMFADSGLVPMQAGSGSSAIATDPPPLEPGSVLAVPLLTGDMEMTAVGTCTERIGDRIFGFGHSFNNEGAINLPVGSGSIATIVANLEASFKLGFISSATGTLNTDRTVGVAGQVGKSAPMAPMELHIIYDDGSEDQTYHFMAALHPKFTPLVTASAVMMAISGEKLLPEYHTVTYDVKEEFAGGKSLSIHNTSVNGDGTEIIADIALPLMAAADNPFDYVPMKSLSATFHVSANAKAAEILSAMVPKTKYEPGDTIKGAISYLPFHADETNLPLEFDLPSDLADGQYQLVVSDWTRYLDDERTANPYKFNAESIGEMFSVLKDLSEIPHDAIFVRLVRQADGVAVGHTEMPHLPPSRLQVMLGSGRSDITPFVTSTVKIIPTGLVMSGSAEFTIDVESHDKTAAAAAGK